MTRAAFRRTAVAGLALAACTAPRAARADGADSLLLHATAILARLDDYGLSPGLGEDEPKPLADKNLRLDGTGALVGAGVRGTIQSRDGVRGGVGFGFFGAAGLDLLHDPLAAGLRTEADGAWGFDVEAFLGKGFRAPPVYPYIDLRIVGGLLQTNVQLKSDALGLLGSTSYDVVTLTIGPRVGLFIPIDHTFFIDLSGSYGIFGPERAGLFAGLGIWDGSIDTDQPESSGPRFPDERQDE